MAQLPTNVVERVCFGVREQTEACLEFVVLGFDYKNFYVLKFVDGLERTRIPFADLQEVQTDGNSVLVIQFHNGTSSRFEPLSKTDCLDIHEIVSSIIENIHETIDKRTDKILQVCESQKPKICLRSCNVVQKSLKRKGQLSGVKKLMKRGNATPQVNISYLLLTEKQLLCFEDEKSIVPYLIYPTSQIHWKPSKSDDRVFSFDCSGDRGTFTLALEHEDRNLWMEACEAAVRVNPEEVSSLQNIVRDILSLYRGKWDKENTDHQEMLVRLWTASNLGQADDGESEIAFALQTNRWKDLGFQRDDPISDLRASGLLGLQNLVYFAEKYPRLFLQMARNQQQSSEMEYPFATAGINISYLMVELLKARRDEHWFPTFQTHPLFFYNHDAWQELYIIVFRCFDKKWNHMLVGYMGFQQVIDATRRDIDELLSKKSVMGVPAVFDMLGIFLEDVDMFKTDMTRKMEKAKCQFQPRGGLTPRDDDQPGSDSQVPNNISRTASVPVEVNPEDNPLKTSRRSSLELMSNTTPTKNSPLTAQTLNRQSYASLPTPAKWKASTPTVDRPPRRTTLAPERNTTEEEKQKEKETDDTSSNEGTPDESKRKSTSEGNVETSEDTSSDD